MLHWGKSGGWAHRKREGVAGGMEQDESDPELVGGYVTDYYTFNPHRAIWDGRHEYDGQAGDFSPEAVQARIAALEHWGIRLETARRAQLAGSPPSDPPAPHGVPLATQAARDLALTEYFRREELFALRDWRPQTFMPAYYLGMVDLSIYLKRPYAPAAERLAALIRHLRAIPDFLANARTSLRGPFVRLALEQGVRSYEAVALYYAGELAEQARALAPASALLSDLDAALPKAAHAVRDFAGYLRERLDDDTHRDIALGGDLFHAIVRHLELLDVPLDHLRAWGEQELATLRARVAEVAGQMKMAPIYAFASLSRGRLPEARVLADTAAAIDELRTFLAQAGIVDVLDHQPYVIGVSPPYLRGGSAFVEPPGPYEQPGLPTFIYITLPDATWPSAARNAWLNKLNPWSLRNTAAHETYPGHLLHFQHLARNPSQAARTFTSFACTEGWAHYSEGLLIEQGYAKDNPRAELAYLRMGLLRAARLLIALNLHERAMTLHEASTFVQRATHFPLVRCLPEAIRATQDPRVVSYTLGKLLLLGLRDDFRRQEGQAYSPRRFHDAFLACGAPPFPLARRMLLRDAGPDPLST